MDGTELQKIRDQLLERRERINQHFEHARENGSVMDIAGNQAEIIDLAQAMEQLDRNRSLAEQERREREMIERALAKMAVGSYGICEECEEDIPERRLSAVPMARLCARCQELEERLMSRNSGTPRAAAR